MIVQSVNAGEYAAAPAHGPRITDTWGTTRAAATFSAMISPQPFNASIPSWMRAPPEPLRYTIGILRSIASRWILVTFAAKLAPMDPPAKAKSCATMAV